MSPALWSVAIQAAGSAATLAAALLVAQTMGLAAQGQFGLLRSWSDALVTLAVLGLPQGLLHMQYRESVPVAALRAWVRRYLLCLALPLALFAIVVWVAQWQIGAASPVILVVLAATLPLAAAHLLWRALALRDAGVLAYAAITAAPALLILLALWPVVAIGDAARLVWALGAAALLSALLSGWVVRRAALRSAPGNAAAPWSRATLWSVGIETGAQSVLTALSPALVLSTVGWLGAPLAQVGVVSLGMHVYQLFGVAAAYVAPLLYDRAARAARPMSGADLVAWLRARTTARRALLAIALAAVALLLVRWAWPAGADSLGLLTGMALAGVVSMAVRLLVTLMWARGAFRPLTLQALLRLLLASGGTALLMRHGPATLAVPIALAGTELLLLAWLVRMMRRAAP